MGSSRNRNRKSLAALAAKKRAEGTARIVAHVARIQSDEVERAKEMGAALQQSTTVYVSEVDESFARLAEATAALDGYVEDIARRLKSVLREVELGAGSKVDRARMLSPMGHKIGGQADNVESACHRLSALLATLAV